MNKLLSILIISTLFSCYKNDKNVISLSKDSDTLFWKKNVSERNNKLISLKNTETSKGDVFRFSVQNLIVEINNLENIQVGKIYLFVQKMEREDGKMEKDIFKKEYILTESQIKQINLLISKSQIKNLPSDKLIKGWNTNGFDGITYIFETKKDLHYTYKHYWSPDFQKKVPEARQVVAFVKAFYTIIDIEKLDKDFRKSIPFKNYWAFY